MESESGIGIHKNLAVGVIIKGNLLAVVEGY